jgi:hypothetical protein
MSIAARQGLEPRYLVPKTSVLPLDDRAMCMFVRSAAVLRVLCDVTRCVQRD